MNALIAPIVSQRRQREGRITAWAVCASSRGPDALNECTSRWEHIHRGGVVLERSDGIDWAIRDALGTGDLVAEEDALLIAWDDPGPILQTRLHIALGALAGCFLVWAVWFLAKSDP